MEFLANGPDDARDVLVLAHGAGGAMDTPFLTTIAERVAACGIRVVRFEFPYMAARRGGAAAFTPPDGALKRAAPRTRAPDREPVLLDAWRRAIDELGGGPRVVIGGKSLGGRMASLVADEVHARGLVCLGYPFHPPLQPQKLRTKHLASLRTPALIVQGERDPFGNREEVPRYELSPNIRVEWIPDGDHSLKPRARSGATEAQNLDRAAVLICDFVSRL